VLKKLLYIILLNNKSIKIDFVIVMDHKYKSLLQNIPTRHLITAVDEKELKKQLTKMKDLDVVNFFILGRLQTLKNVLDAATALKYFNKKFAWFTITQVRMEKGCLKLVSDTTDLAVSRSTAFSRAPGNATSFIYLPAAYFRITTGCRVSSVNDKIRYV